MIINKLKIGLVSAVLSLIAVPIASAQTVKHYKRPVVITQVVTTVVIPSPVHVRRYKTIAQILDISVTTLQRELSSGKTVLRVAKKYQATKAELRQLLAVRRNKN